MKRCLLILQVAFVCAVAVSCVTSDECREDMYVNANAENYCMVFDATKEQYVPRELTLPLKVQGVGNDSILYDTVPLSKFSLPFNSFDTVSSFSLINTETSLSDTLRFRHENRNEYLSLECGCITYFTIKEVEHTTHAIDSVILLESDVTTVSGTNLRIYYHVEE